jgi:hypothetical protein
MGWLAFLDQFVDGKLEITGHGADRLANALAGNDEEREDELGGFEVIFANQAAHGLGNAKPPFAMYGEGHRLDSIAPVLGGWIDSIAAVLSGPST